MTANDPRHYPDASTAKPPLARLHALAAASLAAATGHEAAALNRKIRTAFEQWLRSGDGEHLELALDLAPSIAIYRHLWRLLAEEEREAPAGDALAGTLFAMPVVLVVGRDAPATDSVVLSGVVPDVAELVRILRDDGALAGNQAFGLGNALVAAEALGLAQIPALHAWRRIANAASPRTLIPAPLAIAPGAEGAHLRFLVGSALAAPGADLLRDDRVGAWGIPFAQAVARQLGTPGISLLALPRAPQPPLIAVANGRTAQREVGAQLFASNAIRKLRAAVGEPTAVVSVHRVGDRGGEVRLSLSSPFDPRAAEGFRWPLQPLDRVDDVVKGLTDLMRDCRVGDIRIEPGIHPDRDPGTGLTLLFKSDGAVPP